MEIWTKLIESIFSDTQFEFVVTNCWFFNFSYKCREEFVNDVRQIFDNCEVFNEDDSPVGKAGHGMRKFFELRWTELTDKNLWYQQSQITQQQQLLCNLARQDDEMNKGILQELDEMPQSVYNNHQPAALADDVEQQPSEPQMIAGNQPFKY